ncbi:MAG: lipoyl synthase [Thermodesulfobacteriota bacterium]|jgi:lipoic acid synthetase
MDKVYYLNLGLVPFEQAWDLQKQLVALKKEREFPDFLILLEHPPVYTLGKWGKKENLYVSPDFLKQEGISLIRCERGGDITYHGPGQLVGYPLLNLKKYRLGVKDYVNFLEEVLVRSLLDWEVVASRREGLPGIWVGEKKIASIGIAVQKGIAFHGFALNYAHRRDHFERINPCGLDGVKMTSLQEIKGLPIDPEQVRTRVVFHFEKIFDIQLKWITMEDVRRILDTGYWILDKKTESQPPNPMAKIQQSTVRYPPSAIERLQTSKGEQQILPKPQWLKKRIPPSAHRVQVESLIRKGDLHTVCQEACCPNQGECFNQGTATFLLMGNCCTRNCHFCAVTKGSPEPLNPEEPFRVAQAIKAMSISYAVLTSVTRDDLPDGGSGHFVRTVRAIRDHSPETKIECLIPDFKGSESALAQVAEAVPCVMNHNIETINRLYPSVRPGAGFNRSLTIFKFFNKNYPKILTKSGFMVGLVETKIEVRALLLDLLEHGCKMVTIGQYLQPSSAHCPVKRYVTPEEFKQWEEEALTMGFAAVASGPFVRSSFNAQGLYQQAFLKLTL